MFVLKKYKFKNEEDKELSVNENPVFTDKVNLKAKWTYSKEDTIEKYDLGYKRRKSNNGIVIWKNFIKYYLKIISN